MNGVNYMDEKIVYIENIHIRAEVEKELTKQEKEKNQLDTNKDSPTFQNMLDLAKGMLAEGADLFYRRA